MRTGKKRRFAPPPAPGIGQAGAEKRETIRGGKFGQGPLIFENPKKEIDGYFL
jgi:hypothetical protein